MLLEFLAGLISFKSLIFLRLLKQLSLFGEFPLNLPDGFSLNLDESLEANWYYRSSTVLDRPNVLFISFLA